MNECKLSYVCPTGDREPLEVRNEVEYKPSGMRVILAVNQVRPHHGTLLNVFFCPSLSLFLSLYPYL